VCLCYLWHNRISLWHNCEPYYLEPNGALLSRFKKNFLIQQSAPLLVGTRKNSFGTQLMLYRAPLKTHLK